MAAPPPGAGVQLPPLKSDTGIACMVAGYLLTAWSIGHLELTLVEPLLTTYLVWALMLAVPMSRQEVRLTEVGRRAHLDRRRDAGNRRLRRPGADLRWPARDGGRRDRRADHRGRRGSPRVGLQRAAHGDPRASPSLRSADRPTHATLTARPPTRRSSRPAHRQDAVAPSRDAVLPASGAVAASPSCGCQLETSAVPYGRAAAAPARRPETFVPISLA
jgi:hypothetical protein